MKSLIASKHDTSIGSAVAWAIIYFLLLLFVTIIDIVLWRKIADNISVWLNLGTLVIISVLFFYILTQKTGYAIELFSKLSTKGVVVAIGCAILFWLLLDKCLDPVLESLFPISEADYQDTIITLKKSPLSSFLRVCLVAPFVEEILMRGYILGGLQKRYGGMIALIVSSVLFACLHFNMVQTLSALICGTVLGLIYINTGSLFCCILTHFLYNAVSYFSIIYPIK